MPKPLLECVSAALVASGDEWRFGIPDRLEGGDCIMTTRDACWVGRWPDDNEVVPSDFPTLNAVTGGHEFLLGVRVMNQHEIGVATGGNRQCLARADSDDPHLDPSLSCEFGKDVPE